MTRFIIWSNKEKIMSTFKMKEIKRVFEYHGAEHKTIACYEAGEELTVENVKKHTRFHPRCGTNFLLFTMLISIIVFALLPKFESNFTGIILRMVRKFVVYYNLSMKKII